MTALLRPRLGALDAGALAKAQAALSSLSGQFDGWLNDEIAKLKAAHTETLSAGLGGAAGERLYMRAHDLKGLGGTYGYPLVTRIAGSLCGLLGDAALRAGAPPPLVAAHVDAISMVVERGIKSEEDPAARALADMLEAGVAAHQA